MVSEGSRPRQIICCLRCPYGAHSLEQCVRPGVSPSVSPGGQSSALVAGQAGHGKLAPAEEPTALGLVCAPWASFRGPAVALQPLFLFLRGARMSLCEAPLTCFQGWTCDLL